jgi:hypothetical protein
MTLEEIKTALEALGPAERGEVLAFLLRRRLLEDPSYRADVERRSADGDSSHWLKPEQFEQRLEDFLRRRVAQAKAGDMFPHSVSDIWTEVRDRRNR